MRVRQHSRSPAVLPPFAARSCWSSTSPTSTFPGCEDSACQPPPTLLRRVERFFRFMHCDAVMTARRIALWWRLVLAAGLLAFPVASAAAAPAFVAPTHHAPAVHAAVLPNTAAPTMQIHH